MLLLGFLVEGAGKGEETMLTGDNLVKMGEEVEYLLKVDKHTLT